MSRKKRLAKPWIAAVLIACLAAGILLAPVDRWALELVEWIRGAGARGVGLYSLAYVAATVLLLPGSLLTAGAGFAYGPLLGTLIVSPASVLAATVSFALGRSLARGWVSRKVSGDRRFAAIDEAIGDSGFKIVLLLRLSPIFPFNLLNYALGLTRVRARDYVLASFIGMLPGTVLYVYLGSVVTSASELLGGHDAGPMGQVLYWGGLAAAIVVAVLVTRTARRALRRELERQRVSPSVVVEEVRQ